MPPSALSRSTLYMISIWYSLSSQKKNRAVSAVCSLLTRNRSRPSSRSRASCPRRGGGETLAHLVDAGRKRQPFEAKTAQRAWVDIVEHVDALGRRTQRKNQREHRRARRTAAHDFVAGQLQTTEHDGCPRDGYECGFPRGYSRLARGQPALPRPPAGHFKVAGDWPRHSITMIRSTGPTGT